ncbi:DUF5009 domain-containing protein [Tellurirhabdus bombi]|uniref:DUF5009 domain-containing protein n=1 Tax=Tellurirhabdus bombi TaxID=2907205 RepID=UPI001F389161|nr:DUF5009 domain-containing protein [Tellurirhabdus bombi]
MSNFLSLPANELPRRRVVSIDTFRGITILVMIFVNEVAGMRAIPLWMKHMPADADAMTFVDMVFPSFLFIVGMSVPFALQNRLSKGDSAVQIQGHILFRTLGLLTLGLFMVNAETDFNAAATGMSVHVWSLGFIASAILVWNIYRFQNPVWKYVLRGLGVAGLLVLAIVYRGGDGSERMQTHWWGILGLIGWAYLYTSLGYQLVQGKVAGLLVLIAVCIGVFVVSQSSWSANPWLRWTGSQAGNATHTAIALCGTITSLLFFDQKTVQSNQRQFLEVAALAFVLLLVGYLLRPYYAISKIYATPTWGLYSAAASCLLFSLLYALVDVGNNKGWTAFFQPAAANPLLTYIIPSILYAIFGLLDFYPAPESFQSGVLGMVWAAFFAIAIMGFVHLLNRIGIRLQL